MADQLSTNLVVAGFAFPDNDLPIFTSHSWTDYVQAWHTAERNVTDERWRQAAIAASIETHYGQGSVEKFAQEVGCHPQRVYEYRAAYRLAVAFKERFAERPVNLEFSHFVVAAQAPEPVEMLDRAAEETMTVREMRREIAKTTAAPLSATLAPVGQDPRIVALWEAYQAAGRALAAVVPLASNAITYAEEEVRYILEIPEQSIQDRILHVIQEDGRNEVSTIAQGIGSNRDHVLVWLNRMVELGVLTTRRQEDSERTPGGRGPARIFFAVAES
jgi:hypothetical protein